MRKPAKLKPPPLVIVVDTREQKPYTYPPHSITATLKTGDYSVEGLEDRVTVERKTKEDAYQSVTRGRARFIRELERMATLNRAYIVIESTLAGMLKPPKYHGAHPRSVVNSLFAMSVKYGIGIVFAGSRALGRAATYQVLSKYHRYHHQVDGFAEQQRWHGKSKQA